MQRHPCDDDEDGKRIVPDGGTVFKPLQMMDAASVAEIRRELGTPVRVIDAFGRPAGHRPGFCIPTEPITAQDQAGAAWIERNQRLQDAWRRSENPPLLSTQYDSPEAARAAADAAYETRSEYLRNAWRTRQ